MKTILVPTDFSDHAYYALKTAASIAKKINAEIMIVHLCSLSSSDFAESYYYKEYFELHKTQIELNLDKLLKLDFLAELNVSRHFVLDKTMQTLVSDKKFKNVDLIVIGSHGKSGFNKVLIGSNTEKIIRMADAPVLTIKKETEHFVIRKMVFASNFYKEAYPVFEKIKFFADLYKADIELLKVITPKDFEPTPISKKLIEDFAKEFQLTDATHNIYNASSIEKGITDFCNEKKADLISLTTHGRTGLAHLIHGSLAEHVAQHGEHSVLSVKIKEYPENISGLKKFIAFQEQLEADSK